MKRIAVIGECMIEFSGKLFGTMNQGFGGDSLNTAIYLKRTASQLPKPLDVDVFYVTAMGADSISNNLVSRWEAERLNTSMVLQDNTRAPGLYLIEVNEEGERTFHYWRNGSAAKYLFQHSDIATILEEIEQFDLLFISGISVAILPEKDRSHLVSMLHRCKEKGVTIAFDSNFRPALWKAVSHWEETKAVYEAIFAATDIALLTFDDEQMLWEDNTPAETLSRLASKGVDTTVVRLGKNGCIAQRLSSGKAVRVSTVPVQQVIDSTAAGDSFNGAFLASYLAGYPLRKCCENANSVAGQVIQFSGAIIPNDTKLLPKERK
ncbi:sugar kinase [Parasalinivibrio latis]|uniref:sugar kinase n=1 Tax=Parasalinivibrio latis TaxID=2952610 RepID=UPI0030E35996